MDREQISDTVHRLNDVELALLLCLVADEHCILTVNAENSEKLIEELQTIGMNGFGLTTAVVHCTSDNNDDEDDDVALDRFVGQLLINTAGLGRSQPEIMPVAGTGSFKSRAASTHTQASARAARQIANVLVLKDLDLAGKKIQAQVLEVMRTKRIPTKRGVFEAPEWFLVVALLDKESPGTGLMSHLCDQFFISHYHSPEDRGDGYDSDSQSSVVIRKTNSAIGLAGKILLPMAVIDRIRTYAQDVAISTEIRRYLLDIVTFLRMHRAVKAGCLSAKATRDFLLLVKCLAPLHNLNYATPALVSLAAFKVYNHKLRLVRRADEERSMLYGSSADAVNDYLKQVDVESVIEDVLASVRAPL